MITVSRSVLVVVVCGLVWVTKGVMGGEEPVVNPKTVESWGIKPAEYAEATLHARLPFLNPYRAWERIDIWVPKDATDRKMPCMVTLYGGGYGSKRCDARPLRPLLKQGWVLALPDYILGATAPVPLCAYDVAEAIRFLRANAEKYHIDPERIGVIGWSAGGWIAQDLFYSGHRLVEARSTIEDAGGQRRQVRFPLPMHNPHPAAAPEHSCYVQAVVTDWGAGKLYDRQRNSLRPWVASWGPPLITVYGPNDESGTKRGVPPPLAIVNTVTALRAAGVPAAGAYDYPGNTHVARFDVPVTNEDGSQSTWGEAVFRFLDRHVKHPTEATAPELRPPGGIVAEPTAVTMLSVHPTARIHYTLDGSTPTENSPRYTQPVLVQPGQTVKAIAVRPGLKPSRVSVAIFESGPKPPRLAPLKDHYLAKVGQPFELQPQATDAEGAQWAIAGILNGLQCDPDTGKITGKLRMAIATPITVVCYRQLDKDRAQVDVRQTVILVQSEKD